MKTLYTDEQAQAAVDAHNKARAKEGVKPLSWDSDLATKAQGVAENCLKLGRLQHTPASELYPGNDFNDWNGENLFFAAGSFPDGYNFLVAAVDAWMSEEKDYKNGSRKGVGHYTQVMWSDTTKVGMGLATDGFKVFVAGRYWTAGNVNGRDPYVSTVVYSIPKEMSQKGWRVSEKEMAEWECKWQQQQDSEESKSLLKKFFCCG